jgi:hypothetical protein
MTDPTIPISAMAAVTKNLGFAITASTSFEPPFLLAKRFSSLDHFTKGRIGKSRIRTWFVSGSNSNYKAGILLQAGRKQLSKQLDWTVQLHMMRDTSRLMSTYAFFISEPSGAITVNYPLTEM